ncbi:MAG: PAS domain-containing protein, partial [Planctomycetota bacterium]
MAADESLAVLVVRSAEGAGPAELLEREGAKVTLAATAEQALAALDGSPVDLVLVDLDEAHSASAACSLLRGKLGPSTPIAAAVPGSTDEAAGELRRSGADFTLRDPKEMEAFLASWEILARLSMSVRKLERELPRRVKELNDVRTFADELVASLPTRLYVVDEDMRLLFANRTALEEAGLDAGSAMGRRLAEIIPEAAAEDGPLAAIVRRALFDEQRGRIGGMRLPPASGPAAEGGPVEAVERVVDAEARPCHVAGMRCALVTINDITEAWEAESGRRLESRKLTEVVDSIGAGMASLDGSLRFTWTNRVFVEWFGPSTDRNCSEVFARAHAECSECAGPAEPRDCAAVRALAGGEHETVIRHQYTPEGRRRTFQETFARIDEPGGTGSLIVLVQDVTNQADRVEQMRLAERISHAVQGVRDLDELLHLILTCVTTGHALGFNRAFLFLRNRRTNTLEGRMAVGPASAEEAGRVWSELSASQSSLDDAIRDARELAPFETPLFDLIRDLGYPLDDERELAVRAFREGKAILVKDAWEDDRVSPEFRARFGPSELVAVPLLSKGRAVGVLLADNLYNGRPIEERDLAVLDMFAGPAGLAIENAESFADLRESLATLRRTRRQLVDQTKLAAIGRVAAHIAHEIRNPLATIGGFAHSINARPADTDRVSENARVIYEEVMRL